MKSWEASEKRMRAVYTPWKPRSGAVTSVVQRYFKNACNRLFYLLNQNV